MKKLILIALFLLFFFLTISCFKTDTDNLKQPEFVEEPLPKINKTLIVPFGDMAKVYGEQAIVKSLLNGNYFKTGKVNSDSSDFMTESLITLTKESEKFGIIESDFIGYTDVSGSELASLLRRGKTARADIVLAGYIYRFEDRVGADYAVDSPASVTFHIYIIDVKAEKILKGRSFSETQKPLSDNLFSISKFFKRAGKWVTAKDMAYDGLNNILKELK
ncbi:MAG: hypothetical protein JRJ44_03105 [Deltaproteobacteria bacterium]|nr:hypothetical protein [Deltaproteobacteria bacterium]